MTRSFDECLELTRYRSYCWWVYLSVSWLAMDQLDCVDWDRRLLYLDAFGERNIRPSPPSPANQENAERHRRSSLVVPIRPSADGPSNAEDELDPSSSDAILRAYLVIDIHLVKTSPVCRNDSNTDWTAVSFGIYTSASYMQSFSYASSRTPSFSKNTAVGLQVSRDWATVALALGLPPPLSRSLCSEA